MDKLEFFHAGTKETGCVKVLENKNEKKGERKEISSFKFFENMRRINLYYYYY